MTHICVGNLTIVGLDNGLPPGRRQAIIWTNARILLIGPLGKNFSEIVIRSGGGEGGPIVNASVKFVFDADEWMDEWIDKAIPIV